MLFQNHILKNYVRKQAFWAIFFAIVGLLLLKLLFDYLAEIDSIKDGYNYTQALMFTLLNAPEALQEYMPIGALVGAVIGLGILANHSELTVMQASGLSRFRIVAWVLQPAMIFVILGILLSQFVLPTTNALASQIKHKKPIVATHLDGYWEKTADKIVHIQHVNKQGDLQNAKIWQFNDKGEILSVTQAKTGKFSQNTTQSGWQLHDVQQLNILSNGRSELQKYPTLFAKLPIEPSAIYLLTMQPSNMSLTDLYAHKRLLNKDGRRSLIHEVTFWQKALSPFAVLSLVLVACSFVFGSLRSQSLGFRIVIALLVGLLFSYVQDLVGFISLSTGFSPLVMVLLPIIISAVVGIYLIKRKN